MQVEFRKSFEKDLSRLRDRSLLERIKSVIEEVENAESLEAVNNIKKLKAQGDFYRIRVGEYRVGITIEEAVVFVRMLHRKEIYRYFPS